MRPIARVVGVAALWAAAWAAAGALLAILDPGGAVDGLWVGPPVGSVPGFVGGLVFAVTLAIATRPLHELPAPVIVACGGLVGLLLGLLPFAINEPPEGPLRLVAVVVIGSMTLMGVVSAAGSMALVRGAGGRG